MPLITGTIILYQYVDMLLVEYNLVFLVLHLSLMVILQWYCTHFYHATKVYLPYMDHYLSVRETNFFHVLTSSTPIISLFTITNEYAYILFNLNVCLNLLIVLHVITPAADVMHKLTFSIFLIFLV